MSENRKELSPKGNLVLLFSIFIAAICGLVYELLAGTVSSYLMGDSVYQFSIVIGLFMTSMGVGSFFSRYVNKNLPAAFILVEVLLGLLGGFSTIILFFAFAKIDNYSSFLFLISAAIGTLVGFEIPLVMRILKDYSSVKLVISNIMTFDYIGALVGAILFPLIFVPYLGLIKTGLFFGFFNVLTGAMALWIFKDSLGNRLKPLAAFTSASMFCLLTAFLLSNEITSFIDDSLYSDEIIFSETTPYQRIVITKHKDDTAMFINGSLQFSTRDEYRYHESLVHPAISHITRRENILILGGGDGLAVRELLKYKDVKSISLVDLDSAVTDLFKNNPLLKEINKGSLSDHRVKIFNEDAWKFLEGNHDLFDLIIVDLPDPHGLEISKLYSKSFYKLLVRHLSRSGAMVTQATSPFYSRKAFWCVFNTISCLDSPYSPGEKMNVTAYHQYVPSFGEWGFIMASPRHIHWDKLNVSVKTRFLNNKIMANMVDFPSDMARLDTDINTIDTHKLVSYYEEGWAKWYE